MTLRRSSLLILLATLAAVPAIGQEPVGDPPPASAALAEGLVLHLDWDPFVLDEHDVVYDEDGYIASVDGCEYWAGSDGPPGDEHDVYLREAHVVLGGRRIALDAACIVHFGEGLPPGGFWVATPLGGLNEVGGTIGDAAGSTRLAWLVGPVAARRSDGLLSAHLVGRAADVEAARESYDEAKAALEAAEAEGAPDEAVAALRERVGGRARLYNEAVAFYRSLLSDSEPLLRELGVPVPYVSEPVPTVSTAPEAGAAPEPCLEPAADVEPSDADAAQAQCDEINAGSELNTVYFSFGRAGLDNEAGDYLAENVAYVGGGGDLRACSGFLVVRGYADVEEDEPMALSDQRARAVAQRYVELGVERERILTRGLGAYPSCFPIEDPGPGDARCRVVETAVFPCDEVDGFLGGR